MVFIANIKRALRRFRRNEQGTVTMETVVMLPFLFVGLTMSYEFFDMYRFKSIREKATYTIADMLSRETNIVTDTYIDNTKVLFDSIAADNGSNQVRASVVRYHKDEVQNIDEFELRWSEVRGEGILQELTDEDVKSAFAHFPTMTNGQDLILVDTYAVYDPGITIGLSKDTEINTSMFMSLRFASQLCYTGVCVP